jgi:hypothetical protein
MHQQMVGGPGMGSKGGKPHGRTLAQLLRLGMKAAPEGIYNVFAMCNFKWLRVAEMAHSATFARLIVRSAVCDIA